MSESAEQWAWAQPVDSTMKIVLYWMAHMEVPPPPSTIARLSNLPHRTVAHAKDRLISGGFIKAENRGEYKLLMGVQRPTGGRPETHEHENPSTPTQGRPETHPRPSRARASSSTTTSTTGQASLLPEPKWVAVIYEPNWIKTRMTPQQIATIEQAFKGLDLNIEATKWGSHHSEKSTKPRALAKSFINWCGIAKAGSNGTNTGHDAIGRGGGFKPAGVTYGAFDGIDPEDSP